MPLYNRAMPKEKTKRSVMTVNLTLDGRHLLELLARHLGISMGAVIEIAIRDRARIEGVKLPDDAPELAVLDTAEDDDTDP